VDLIENNFWAIFLGQGMVASVMAFCAWLILKRLNYYASVLLKNSIDTTEERKSSAIHTANALATEREGTAKALSQKVDETAVILSQKVEETATVLASKVEGNLSSMIVAMQKDLKEVHSRLRIVEGHKEKDIEHMIDTHEIPNTAEVLVRAPLSREVADRLLAGKDPATTRAELAAEQEALIKKAEAVEVGIMSKTRGLSDRK